MRFDFALGSALRSRLSCSAWLALCGAVACGPIGGVASDSGTNANGEPATGTGAGGSAGAAPVMLPDPPAFKTVGYWPSWAGAPTALQFDKLNYIDYAFAIENPDGSVTLPDPPTLLSALVGRAHQAGVRVLLSIGGWNNGNDSGFNTISASADARSKFATTLGGYVNQYQLDGVDIDWEYPEADVAQGYTAMMQELSAVLRPNGKLLTIAGAAFNGGSAGITADAIQYIDMVNIMAYDGGPGPQNASPFSFAQSSLALWQSKGFSSDKLILGVPFYSRPNNVPYSTLVRMDPAAANEDDLGGEYYNGIPTIQQKTAFAMMQGGGMMAWDLSEDAPGTDLSLLSAIYSTIQGAP
ncbi:MAG TPA: glycosyl hydrolase family 18 protein [Polyangiaceae bacterium]|jgi:GH18 family chitinase|nr:glycosyl hydrolase family 18 protein [Polyangiaceae bacterium]